MGRRLTGRTGTFSHLERYNPFDDSINNDKKNLGCGRKKDKSTIIHDRIIGNTGIIIAEEPINKSKLNNKTTSVKEKVDYYVGMQVVHLQFGTGKVVSLSATKVRIKFDNRDRGIKDFDRKTVFKGNIVMPLKTVMKKVDLRSRW